MPLDDFQGNTDAQDSSGETGGSLPKGDPQVGAVLEQIVQDTFDDLDNDNSKSFHYNEGKVVVDRQELVEEVMLMCAMTAHEVNS